MKLEEIETRNPKPIVVKTIIRYSLSDDFEEARNEWELIGPIDSTSLDFTDHCELCNSLLTILNWEIENIHTKVRLKVGSKCIKRFVILHGTASQEDTIRYISNAEKEWGAIQEIRLMYRSVVLQDKPLARDLNRFHNKLKEILANRGYYPLPDDFKIENLKPIYESIFGFDEPPPLKEQWKLYQIIYDPSKISVTREKRMPKQKQYKEGETLNKRRRVTYTTLSRSSIYRPDHRY